MKTRFLAIFSLLACQTAFGAVLLKYPFNNPADGSSGLGYTTFDGNILATATISSYPFTSPGPDGLSKFLVQTDEGLGDVLTTAPGAIVTGANASYALSNNWYFQITLSPKTAMDIRSIQLDWSRGGTGGARGWFVRSSVDNYASNLHSVDTPNGTPVGLNSVGFDFTSHTGLASETTFRFYIYTDSTGRYVDFRNIQFNSHSLTTPIPEPSLPIATASLLALGMTLRRRRSH